MSAELQVVNFDCLLDPGIYTTIGIVVNVSNDGLFSVISVILGLAEANSLISK